MTPADREKCPECGNDNTELVPNDLGNRRCLACGIIYHPRIFAADRMTPLPPKIVYETNELPGSVIRERDVICGASAAHVLAADVCLECGSTDRESRQFVQDVAEMKMCKHPWHNETKERPIPVSPADVCPKRLTPEREYELREYLRRIFDPRSTGYDGYPYPEDRDRAMLLAEIDTLRAERDKLAAELERLVRKERHDND